MAININVPAPAFLSNLLQVAPKTQAAGLRIYTDRSTGDVRVLVALQNINVTQNARISDQMIRDGRVFYYWRRTKSSDHLDLMQLGISGTTLNLMPTLDRDTAKAEQANLLNLSIGGAQEVVTSIRSLFPGADQPQTAQPGNSPPVTPMSTRQREWLRFWDITRQPSIDEQGVNNHYIELQTPALPVNIVFIGHFNGPIQWEQASSQPFLATWRLSMTVHRTSPDVSAIQYMNFYPNQ